MGPIHTERLQHTHRLVGKRTRAAVAASVTAIVLAACASTGLNSEAAFYQYDDAVGTAPGQMLRVAPLPAELGLSDAGTQVRILYTSTDGHTGEGQRVTSGAVFLPHGGAPEGGWPIMAWAHGTVGIGDACAPSRNARTERDASYLNAWLREGFAVVATDYQGLGTEGPHLYLHARAEAYSVLDSVRAALTGVDGLSNRVFLLGQSQGGGAAFATAAYAPEYAPDVQVLGTVATGAPNMSKPSPSPYKPDQVNPTLAYAFYLGQTVQALDPSIQAGQLFQDGAMPLYEQSATTCLHPLWEHIEEAGLTNATTMAPGGVKLAFGTIGKTLLYPTYKLEQPLFMGTGSVDMDVSTEQQLELAADACAAGTHVQQHVYKGLDHSATVNGSLVDSVPFVKALLAGQPVPSTCGAGSS